MSSAVGVGTVALLFLFAIQAFQSVAIGVVACLALMGWRCFIEFHGARQAVQDSQLVFLSTLAIYLCWGFFVRLQQLRPSWKHALAAGSRVGVQPV